MVQSPTENQQAQNTTQYFPDYTFKEENVYKKKANVLFVKFRYWVWKAWPTIRNFLTFLFYWAYRAVKGILITAKDEIRMKGN